MNGIKIVSPTEILVTFDGFGGGGYEWTPPERHVCAIEKVPNTEFDPGDIVGCSPSETFRLRGSKGSTHRLAFALKRPWEVGAEQVEEFTITFGD